MFSGTPDLQSSFSPLALVLYLKSTTLICCVLRDAHILYTARFRLTFRQLVRFEFVRQVVRFPVQFFTVRKANSLLFQVRSADLVRRVVSREVFMSMISIAFTTVCVTMVVTFSPVLTTVILLRATIVTTVSVKCSIEGESLISHNIRHRITTRRVLTRCFKTVRACGSLNVRRRVLGH